MQASTAAKQTSPSEALTHDLALLIKHLIHSTGRDVFQAIDELELSFTQIKAAQLLAEAEEPLSLGAIGERLALSLPAVSRAVDGLVKRGLCTREEDPADRRSKRIVITSSGRHLYDRVHEIRAAGIREFVDELAPAQRDALLDALRPIARDLR
jgi:DNA-binding MarR family transcriptional regulator